MFFCSRGFGLFSVFGYYECCCEHFVNYNVSSMWAGLQSVLTDFVCRYLQCLEQYLAHGRCPINIWGMNVFLYVSPGAHVQELGSCFQSVVLGSLRIPETLSGNLWGQTIFLRISKHYLTFSLWFFHEFKYMPDIWWCYHFDS